MLGDGRRIFPRQPRIQPVIRLQKAVVFQLVNIDGEAARITRLIKDGHALQLLQWVDGFSERQRIAADFRRCLRYSAFLIRGHHRSNVYVNGVTCFVQQDFCKTITNK